MFVGLPGFKGSSHRYPSHPVYNIRTTEAVSEKTGLVDDI